MLDINIDDCDTIIDNLGIGMGILFICNILLISVVYFFNMINSGIVY